MNPFWHRTTRGLRIASASLSKRCISLRTMIEHLFPQLMARCGRETRKANEINGQKISGGPGSCPNFSPLKQLTPRCGPKRPFETQKLFSSLPAPQTFDLSRHVARGRRSCCPNKSASFACAARLASKLLARGARSASRDRWEHEWRQ